jgi:hypothetical protein
MTYGISRFGGFAYLATRCDTVLQVIMQYALGHELQIAEA